MEIVGNGFLARNLRPIADAHPGVVVLAAGVSAASNTSLEQFAREAALVRDTVARCRRDAAKLLFFSTASTGMYGAPGCRGREDEPAVPCSPYGQHKLALETVIGQSAVDYLVLRLGHVVGPLQPPHQLLPSLARQVRSGSILIHRTAHRDLIDIAHVTKAIAGLLSAGVSGEVVNVASGVAVPVEAIVAHIERRVGRAAEHDYVDVAGNHDVAIDKLLRLVPGAAGMGFRPDYYKNVLDKYLDQYLEAPVPA
jgi:nucleoside-diphosphate-sugar epimerase